MKNVHIQLTLIPNWLLLVRTDVDQTSTYFIEARFEWIVGSIITL